MNATLKPKNSIRFFTGFRPDIEGLFNNTQPPPSPQPVVFFIKKILS